MKTTYRGVQEQRIIEYTASGQKAKPKEHVSTTNTNTGHSSKSPEAHHASRLASDHDVEAAKEHARAQTEQPRIQSEHKRTQ
jgi:hypothetical protein